MALLFALVSPAQAHDWYPFECCGGMDCAPAMSVETLPNFALHVASKHGKVIIPPAFPRRESKDGQVHVCMAAKADGLMRPICIFMPPSQ